MDEALPGNPFSTKRLLYLFVTAYLTGSMAGTFLCYRQPKLYEATATIESPDHAGHPERISRLRAQMVARDLDLDNRFAISFNQAVAVVEEAVRLKPSALGVTVSVRSIDSKDARLIAEQVALGLDTPHREAAMAARGIQVAPFTAHEASAAADIGQLVWLLHEEAGKAGYSSWHQIPALAAAGDEKASEIMNREDFSRRFQMMKELSPKIGYFDPPGEPFKGHNLFVKVGDRPEEPVSPVPALWINGGRAVAMLLAGLIFLALKRWKPSVLRPYPAKPPRPAKPRAPAPPSVNKDPW